MVILYILLITTLAAGAQGLQDANGLNLSATNPAPELSASTPGKSIISATITTQDALNTLAKVKGPNELVVNTPAVYELTKGQWDVAHSQLIVTAQNALLTEQGITDYSYEVDARGVIWVVETNHGVTVRHIADMMFEGMGNSTQDAQAYSKFAAPIIDANWEEYASNDNAGHRETHHAALVNSAKEHPAITELKETASAIKRLQERLAQVRKDDKAPSLRHGLVLPFKKDGDNVIKDNAPTIKRRFHSPVMDDKDPSLRHKLRMPAADIAPTITRRFQVPKSVQQSLVDADHLKIIAQQARQKK